MKIETPLSTMIPIYFLLSSCSGINQKLYLRSIFVKIFAFVILPSIASVEIGDSFVYHLSCLIYKISSNNLPSYLGQKLIKLEYSHAHSTRNQHLYCIPKHSTSMYERSFTYNAAKIYNAIPPEIKSAPTLASFRKQIKKHLLTCQNGF